jgi:hypothetical protein
MSGRFSNKQLGIVFAVLLVILVIFLVTDGGKNERTFREELVNIDTSAVTEIKLYPRATNYEEVRLFSEDGEWKVQLTPEKIVNVPNSKIKNLLNNLIKIVPKRLAARGSDKWQSFEVDSTGTRVEIYEGNDKTLDIIIGRFAFQQPRSMNTYVRLANDTDVYEVEGFLSAVFNQNEDNFRDNTIIKDDHENWNSLTFDYPADSSFQMIRLNNKWFVNDVQTDSAKTVKYFRSIQRLTSSNFLDVDVSGRTPEYKLTIDADSTTTVVRGYDLDSTIAIKSSLNESSIFDGSKAGLTKKIFIGMNSLFGE